MQKAPRTELEPVAKIEDHIRALAAKASQAEKSDDAMRFSQAACNAANAFAVLDFCDRENARAAATDPS
ncbi:MULTISPECIES: hypothetical protein [unclassified Aurantimonas]|uniref:hypothetical protein n=1 Tax=unclassified Aurantimonas TaxID=2638230 RepID=UPI002E18C12C|nr:MULTISPECIES: hypothetical protein [unclassified Aurantimonas]MEC5291575.1 hypothetical protein [Aurantimonas sp. C2-3-R2]MEC5412659.1 hypothetical protein [Aurantimonas sp. C2-4-R8]